MVLAKTFSTSNKPPFDQLPADPDEKSAILRDAEESFRLFYGMVERIFSLKEEEERVRQAAEVRR
ncbi:Reverse transcriptase domain-containing protein [Aphis craccivora]|uniref:Reverse transcriptase domain-containing protein n=1 Tax=Aphis craccivora TaxID=307492 RepID=A0A6G0ZQK5_APHCR|nr:Reverse transcriptase domain-containing protein [Aphis craccivora]